MLKLSSGRTKKNWLRELEQQALVRAYNPDNLSSQELGSADINIYHIGNNSKFHGAIYKVSCQYPGIVVIHDLNLHYLFTSLYNKYREPGSDQNTYLDLMRSCHGELCKQDLDKFFSDKLDWATIAERYPLTFAAVKNALGVVVHTREGLNTFRQDRRCSCPILYSPLPYPPTPIHLNVLEDIISPPPYRLIIFGYLGGMYRRVQSVLQALGTMPEKSNFHLDIYGQIWDEGYIQELIQQFGLEKIVTLHGFVLEATLDKALANADLAINLRYPSGGEASGSQLRIWSHALPSLVTRIGWYADLPEFAVAFVRHDREIEDIQQHLRNFLAHPVKFAKMGRRGQQLLLKEHAPDTYARRIIQFAMDIFQSKLSVQISSSPKVSVIIPTYNCGQYIQQAVESVLQQSFTDYEIIVVDDGSTDNTQAILKNYCDRIRYTAFQHNQGVAVARNRGLEMARGELVAFLDADDWYFPDKLETEVAYFDNHDSVGMLKSGCCIVNEQGEMLVEVEPWHHYSQINLETWLSLKPIVASTMTLQKKWLDWVGGFDTNFHYGEDINLILRLTLMNCQAKWLPQITVYHRQFHNKTRYHNPGKSKHREKALANLFAQVNLPEQIQSIKDRTLHDNLVWLAWTAYQTGHPGEKARYLRKSLNYKNCEVVDVVSNWVSLFRQFSLSYGYKFDAYDLSSQKEWKNLVSELFNI